EFPEQLPTLVGDPAQLKQVFLNILTNAIQASRPEGTLTVQILIESQAVRASIIDTGVGIPKDKIKAIFDPFMTTKEDGTGLGLPLALRIVEEHNGHIEVESTEGSGSRFSILLPLPTDTSGVSGHD
nr:ATP-binding protein [Candidatus Ozemobacteraceae bacterium]